MPPVLPSPASEARGRGRVSLRSTTQGNMSHSYCVWTSYPLLLASRGRVRVGSRDTLLSNDPHPSLPPRRSEEEGKSILAHARSLLISMSKHFPHRNFLLQLHLQLSRSTFAHETMMPGDRGASNHISELELPRPAELEQLDNSMGRRQRPDRGRPGRRRRGKDLHPAVQSAAYFLKMTLLEHFKLSCGGLSLARFLVQHQ